MFPRHEWLSPQIVSYDLVGEYRHELASIIIGELCHRIGLKLSLGQRVALATDELTTHERQQITAVAEAQGAQVISLLGETMPARPARSLPIDSYSYLRATWKGITVVGDLHGNLKAFNAALDWAQSRQHFLWLLGDIIDYGPDTLATADAVYQAVMAGYAALILGNHERKIARWLDHQSRNFRLSEGNRVTIAALDALDSLARRRWVGRFRSLLGHASLMQQIGNITLLHAAAHPSLWNHKPDQTLIEQYALYGEGEYVNGKFRRMHHWVDAVPAGQLVLVGHDHIADFPLTITGAKGGRVVFLDTGCGTGGRLSTADLRFDAGNLHLECFNRH